MSKTQLISQFLPPPLVKWLSLETQRSSWKPYRIDIFFYPNPMRHYLRILHSHSFPSYSSLPSWFLSHFVLFIFLPSLCLFLFLSYPINLHSSNYYLYIDSSQIYNPKCRHFPEFENHIQWFPTQYCTRTPASLHQSELLFNSHPTQTRLPLPSMLMLLPHPQACSPPNPNHSRLPPPITLTSYLQALSPPTLNHAHLLTQSTLHPLLSTMFYSNLQTCSPPTSKHAHFYSHPHSPPIPKHDHLPQLLSQGMASSYSWSPMLETW